MKKRIVSALLALVMILLLAVPSVADTADWKYSASDGGLTLESCLMSGGNISIPSVLDDTPVSSIAPGAFAGMSELETVMFLTDDIALPDGLFSGFGGVTVICEKGGKVESWCAARGINTRPLMTGTVVGAGGEAGTEEITITLPTPSIRLGVKQQWQADAFSADDTPLIYSSTKPKIASVDGNGLVTALKKGSAKIKVTAEDGSVAYIKVTVVKAPSSIKAAPESNILGVGETTRIKTTIAKNTAASFTYLSKNTEVATVDDSGVITAVGKGSARIVVKSHNGKKARFTVTVMDAPSSVECAYPEVMGVKQTFKLAPEVNEGAWSSFTYESSDTNIVKVSPKGVMTAMGEGAATITVRTYVEGVTFSFNVTVTPAPEYILLGVSTLTLGLKETYTLSPDTGGRGAKITYTSSTKRVAKVDSNGVITALKKGKTTITARTHNGKTAKVKVTVKALPKGIRLQTDEIRLYYKDTYQVTYSLSKNSYAQVTFSVSDESVCTVDENGLISGIKAGECEVTATTSNGYSDSAHVIVYDDTYPTDLKLPYAKIAISEGEKLTLEPVFTPADADKRMDWSVSDKSIAKVSKDGVLTGVSHGLCTLEGTSAVNPDLSVSCTVIVLDPTRTLVMPEQRTTPDGLSANLSQINKIYNSAVKELECDLGMSSMSSSEYSRRKSILKNAFAMYKFPFVVNTRQAYWKAKNSNNGKKDFIPGTVYYGLPYTSYASTRKFNEEKAVSQGYYSKTGKYYTMNQNKRLNGTYVGNDCSAFCSMAIWGANSPYSYLRTVDMYSTDIYTTITDRKGLKPGDIIVKGNAHVVMFLYYANEAKTQIVIMEQGGAGLYTNTIWTSIKYLSKYTSDGYIMRRLTSY